MQNKLELATMSGKYLNLKFKLSLGFVCEGVLTFFLRYEFDDLRSFSTSPAKSRLISCEQMLH